MKPAAPGPSSSQLPVGERAEHGEQIVSTLTRQLEADYGRGFSDKNLRHMLRFTEVFSNSDIVSAVRRQLSWSHIKTLIYIAPPLKDLLQAKLHEAIERSRARLENQNGGQG